MESTPPEIRDFLPSNFHQKAKTVPLYRRVQKHMNICAMEFELYAVRSEITNLGHGDTMHSQTAPLKSENSSFCQIVILLQ